MNLCISKITEEEIEILPELLREKANWPVYMNYRLKNRMKNQYKKKIHSL